MLVPDRPWNRAPFHAKASIKFAHWFDAAGAACQRERVRSSLRGHPVVSCAASTWCHHGKVFSDCLGSPSRGTQHGLRSRTPLQTGVRSEAGIPGQDGPGRHSVRKGARRQLLEEKALGARFIRGGQRCSSRVARLCRFASPRPFRWLENRGEARNQKADSGQGQRMLDLPSQNVCPGQLLFAMLKN